MKLKTIKSITLGVLGLAIVGCQSDAVETSNDEVQTIEFEKSQDIVGSYIVVYNNSNNRISPLAQTANQGEYLAQMEELKETFVSEFKDQNISSEVITATYGHTIKGFAAKLTDKQADALRNDPRIKSIEQDKIIALAPPSGKGPKGGGGSDPAQETPYGTTRMGGAADGTGRTAWVIDSGIDLDHPDLNVDVNNSISFVRGDADDQNGHGTHVAGTIAAINNGIGSVGVAAGATVVAVRVLDRRGSGSTSGVIAGVDYVGANAGTNDVANMSLGGGVSTALDDAVIAASATCKFALAAGNESDNANNHSPARANGPNIYTISAMNSSDNWASFSNFGNSVDYCAPGVAVYSTWKSGGYNSISGTSMAAPHAAGVLLMGNPSTDGTVNNDPDGNPDPIIHL